MCSLHLRHINKMSRYLPMATKEGVVNAIITPRLDYCNSLLYGSSVSNIARLQRIHNSAARLMLCRPQSDSAMPLLCIFHWLPVPQRIEFKLVFTYKAVHGDAPEQVERQIFVHSTRLLSTYTAPRGWHAPIIIQPRTPWWTRANCRQTRFSGRW